MQSHLTSYWIQYQCRADKCGAGLCSSCSFEAAAVGRVREHRESLMALGYCVQANKSQFIFLLKTRWIVQWCMVGGWEKTDMSWIKRDSDWIQLKSFVPWEQSSIKTDCLEGFCFFHPCRFSRPDWLNASVTAFHLIADPALCRKLN